MLVVSLRNGESVKLDGPGEVRFLKMKGRVVKVGVEAPESTRIIRMPAQVAPEEGSRAA